MALCFNFLLESRDSGKEPVVQHINLQCAFKNISVTTIIFNVGMHMFVAIEIFPFI